jgi:hypothetical protein
VVEEVVLDGVVLLVVAVREQLVQQVFLLDLNQVSVAVMVAMEQHQLFQAHR